jgi:hypothetical protein
MFPQTIRPLFRILFVTVLAIAGTSFIGHTTGYAEMVEVEGQADCPGGNDGWQRHLIVDIASKRTFVRCVRVEQVVVTPEPTPTPAPSGGSEATPAPASVPAPVTVSRVVGTDPYPSLPTGGEIPGTRTWSSSETSWAQFATNSMASGWSCPAIYGPNGDPYAAENNGFDNATGKWFRVCVKNPWREPINPQVLSNYAKTKSDAQAAALALSEKWNKENPGLQKCFQWGPLTSPNGGTESGGMCANVFGTEGSRNESKTATSSDSSTAFVYSADPLPQFGNGREIPGTRVNGQIAIVCPNGSASAIEVNASTKAVYTLCIKNWTPTRIAQDVFDSGTASAQIETTTVVAAQMKILYFPKTSTSDSARVTIGSEPIDFKGSLNRIAEVVDALELTPSEDNAISVVTSKLGKIKSTSKLIKIALPNSPALTETAISLTPSVCKVSGLTVQPKKTGNCQISYSFEGESGNNFETTKKISFKK